VSERPRTSPSPARIRPADPADTAALFRVRTSVHENHQSEEELARIGVTRESVAQLLASPGARGWCAEQGGSIVAFAIARRTERDLFALFVEPGFERRGLGSSLLESAVTWLRAGGIERIRLSTGRGTRAQSFYEKRGWKDAGSPGEQMVMLERACRSDETPS
jgi:GNAT superfamily N-acetyltransferase